MQDYSPTHVRSLFISDLHLGCRYARPEALLVFLEKYSPEHLYLVGDVIDGWKLGKRWHWQPIYNRVLDRISEMILQGTKVTYLPGNHDALFRNPLHRRLLTDHCQDLAIVDELVFHAADGRRFLVTHGDKFDWFETQASWLSKFLMRIYDPALCLSRTVRVATACLLSYVHYVIYAATLREPGPISFARFKRDAIFFKTISFAVLLAVSIHCFWGVDSHWWSSSAPWILGVVFLTGCLLSGLAAYRLGVDRTFFGSELAAATTRKIRGNQAVTPATSSDLARLTERTQAFPYGSIPHPMVLGTALWLVVAIGMVPGLHTLLPWLIPGHLIAYGIISWQEISLQTSSR